MPVVRRFYTGLKLEVFAEDYSQVGNPSQPYDACHMPKLTQLQYSIFMLLVKTQETNGSIII